MKYGDNGSGQAHQNMPLWQIDYFEFKLCKKHPVQEGQSDLTLYPWKQEINLHVKVTLSVAGDKETFLSPETGNSRFISLFITPSPNSFILSILCRCVFCCPKGRKDSCSSHFFASSFSCEGSPVHVKIQFLLCMLFSCSSVFASLIIRPSQRPHECGRKFFLPLPHC